MAREMKPSPTPEAERYDWIMSPQAHRRLCEHITECELRDLAKEIARNLGFTAYRGDAESIIFKTLTWESNGR